MQGEKRIGSIYRQIAGMLIVFVAGTIILYWLFNTWFLESYYMHNKETTMKEAFAVMNEQAGNETLYDEQFRLELEKICANGNLSVIIVSPDGRELLSSAGAHDTMINQLLDTLFFQGDGQEDEEVVSSEENYVIERQTSRRLKDEYLVLWGTLADGNTVMMRSAVQSIKESVELSNRFLLFVGAFAIVAGMVVAHFLTKQITNPLVRLTEISKRMTQMDFDAKYISQEYRNEVDVLGEHMNELSGALEKNIIELRQANEDLQRDIDLKEKEEQRRKELISNISHELKTPLALVQGYGEGLLEGVSADEESRAFYCEVIVDEAKKMNRIVRQLLALNELEAGTNIMHMEAFDITALISGMIAANQLLLDSGGVTLTFPYQQEMMVWADPFYTEQVLSNYLSNAMHHVDDCGNIDIKLQPGQELLRISVFNTGEPIPQEDLEHIWDKFYKVDKARTRQYGGSGIGLSVVKAILDDFGQNYGVVNHKNGVEFWFELEIREG